MSNTSMQTTPAVDPAARALATRMQTIKGLAERARQDLAQALPKHMTVDRMLKVFYAAVSRTPSLLECSPLSLLMALMQASETGLEPNTALQHAYLIPRNNKNTRQKEAHFMPSYRGLVHLATQSGKVRALEAVPVYQRDHYVNKRTLTGRVFEHEQFVPDVLTDDRGAYQDEVSGPLRLVYSIAQLVDAEPSVEIMTRSQIEDIRQRSGSPNEGPWVSDFDEMARKTVLRRHCKHLPASTEREGGKLSQAERMAGALDVQAALEEGRSSSSVITGEMTARLLEEASAIPPLEGGGEKVMVQVPAAAPVEAKGPAADTSPGAADSPAKTKRAQALLDKVAKKDAPAPTLVQPPAPPVVTAAPWESLEVGEIWTDSTGVRCRVAMNQRLGGKQLEPLAAEADAPPEPPEPGSEG